MQSAEEFMLDFLCEQITDVKRELESRAPFRRRFYAVDCFYDSRAGTLAMRESERIVSLSSTDTKAEVVTEFETRLSGDIRRSRNRYHIQSVNDQWLIQCFDSACFQCFGTPGKSACFMCGGEGWISGKIPDSKPPEDDPPSPRPQPPPRRF
jgi:hypothetical protein